MAKGKNSFILYADYYDQIKDLTNEEAGILVKHLFSYVNDEDPEPLEDRLLRLVFEPIKKQLKRDLKSWEGEIAKKSESGRLGNLKKYNEDLYDRVKTHELSLPEAEKLAELRKVSHREASVAVTVTDNVPVTVTDTVTEETPTPPNPLLEKLAAKEFLIPVMMNQWLEKIPNYFPKKEKDFTALQDIAKDLAVKYECDPLTLYNNDISKHVIKLRWGELVTFISGHAFFKKFSLEQIAKNLQSIFLSKDNDGNEYSTSNKGSFKKHEITGAGGY